MSPALRKFLLSFGLFFVSICLRFALFRLILPVPVTLNLFFAELLVFNLYPAIYFFSIFLGVNIIKVVRPSARG